MTKQKQLEDNLTKALKEYLNFHGWSILVLDLGVKITKQVGNPRKYAFTMMFDFVGKQKKKKNKKEEK